MGLARGPEAGWSRRVGRLERNVDVALAASDQGGRGPGARRAAGARRGRPAPSADPDLILAASALEHGATVLHYDRDFDLIAETTGLNARWIIPAGTGFGRPR